MNDTFLGIIAFAVLVMAIVQVGLVVFAARAAKRVEELAQRLEQDIRPVVANLNAMTGDAARAASVAAAQVERADRLFGELAQRVDQTLTSVQQAVSGPAREGFAVLAGLRAALAAFRDLRQAASPARRTVPVEDEDALFIG